MPLIFPPAADIWLAEWWPACSSPSILGLAGLYYYAPPEYTRVGYAPSSRSRSLTSNMRDGWGCRAFTAIRAVEESSVAQDPVHPDVHELPSDDQSRQPAARGGAGELDERASRFPGSGSTRLRTMSSSTTPCT